MDEIMSCAVGGAVLEGAELVVAVSVALTTSQSEYSLGICSPSATIVS
jgi:hypothetical protein